MYQALYRKWRPQVFDDVIGQEHITVTLRNEIAAGKQSHAYLFTGSRGTGKTTCAKIIAKAVNCPNQQNGNPCNRCEICHGIDNGSIMDVLEIDAASNNGVDDVRSLREEAYFLPAMTKYRVYIMDEVHMLSQSASNALLKIMEEPPAHVLFILATTEIHKVLATILSRCQRFDFKRIRSDVISDRLLHIAEQEQMTLDAQAGLLIARLSDGGMRDALSLLDLCSSYNNHITVQTVNDAVGLAGQEHLFDIVDAAVQGKPQDILEILARLSEYSIDYERFCEQMITHYRNLMIVKTARNPDDLIAGTLDELSKLSQQCAQIDIQRILYSIEVMQETLTRMTRSVFKRTELEMAAIKLCECKMGGNVQALTARIEQLERKLQSASAMPAVPLQSTVSPVVIAPQPLDNPVPTVQTQAAQTADAPATPVSVGKKEVAPFARWAEVLETLRKINGALWGTLVDSKAFETGELLLIDSPNERFLQLVRQSQVAKESLREAAFQVTGCKYNLGPYHSDRFQVAKKADDPLDALLENSAKLGVEVHLK